LKTFWWDPHQEKGKENEMRKTRTCVRELLLLELRGCWLGRLAWPTGSFSFHFISVIFSEN
jgi:hypothetical protein